MKRKEMQADKILIDRLDLLRTVPGRDPQAAASGRENFLKQAEALGTSRSTHPEYRLAGLPRTSLFALTKKGGRPALNALVAIFLALVLVFGGTALTVYAAQDSLPSEALYPVKTLSEDALLSLTPSSQARLNLTLDFIDRRLAEISGLQSAGRPIPQKVVDRLQGELDQVLTLTAGMDNPAMAQSLDEISQRTHGQLRAMAILVNGNPGGPALVGIQALLKEQAQAVDLGKADPQWFRQKVHQLIPGGNGQQGNRSNKPLGNQNPTKTPETPGDQGHGHGHGSPEPTPGPGKGHGHGG
ncbi:MAG: DUF5667 domain-containing protein [Anaerolineales bacterium]|jgi:hypothetical protein